MLQQAESVPDALGIEEDRIIQVAVVRVFGAPEIKQRFAGMKHEGDFDLQVFACLDHGEKLITVVADVVCPVFCADKIESCEVNQYPARERHKMLALTYRR